MAGVDYWTGGGTADAPRGGNLLSARNWSDGLPDKNSDAVLGPGRYQVVAQPAYSMQGYTLHVHSFTVGKGVDLAIVAQYTDFDLRADSGITNNGTIDVLGGNAFVDFYGGRHASFTNNGTLDFSAVEVTAGVSCRFQNKGVVEVSNGSAVFFNNLAGIKGGVLGTGSYVVHAGSGLIIDKDVITIGGKAHMVLDGAGSLLATGASGTTIDATLGAVDAGGSLSLLGGRGMATGHDLSVAGALVLDGGTLSTTALDVAKGGSLAGHGTVEGAVADAGRIAATATHDDPGLTFDGHLVVSGALEALGATVTVRDGLDLEAGARLAASVLEVHGPALAVDTDIDAGATSLLLDGTTLALGTHDFSLRGYLAMSSSDITGTGTLGCSGTAQVFGTCSNGAALDLKGTLAVYDGSLAQTGAVSGGTVELRSDGSGVAFGGAVAATTTVQQDGSGASLSIDDLADFHALIRNTAGSGEVDLTGVAAVDNYQITADGDGTSTLTLLEQGSTVGTLHFAGTLYADASSDGHDGTLVSYQIAATG